MTRRIVPVVTLLCAFAAAPLNADVKTSARTFIKFEGTLGRMIGLFGGSKEPKASTVVVRGDRKATLTEGTGRIIDLSEEKVYDVDARRKTYKVTTFQQLRDQMKEAQEEAAEQVEEPEKADERTGPEYEIDFEVKETGATKAMAGYDTRQVISIVTMRQKGKTLEEGGGLVLTSDMWIAPRIAALDEIAAFDRTFAEKVYGDLPTMSLDQLAALLAMHPGFEKAQQKLSTEGEKLQGTPLMTTMTLESVKDPSAAQSEGSQGMGGLAGRLMRRTQDAPGTKTKVFGSTHEITSVAASAADADVAIPADFTRKSLD